MGAGERDSLFVHCLFRKEQFSFYTLLRVSVDQEQLRIDKVSMFGFPICASNIVTDATHHMIVAYNPDQVFSKDVDVEDYYLVGDVSATKEIILMGVDTQGPETG